MTRSNTGLVPEAGLVLYLRRRLGRVIGFLLAVSAASLLLQAEPQQPLGTWVSMGAVADARIGAAAVALPDGRTLIAGGIASDGAATNSVIVYDPLTNSSSTIGQLIASRTNHTATLLEHGRVLVTGGLTNGLISSDIELFDAASGTSQLVATMTQARTDHAAAPAARLTAWSSRQQRFSTLRAAAWRWLPPACSNRAPAHRRQL